MAEGILGSGRKNGCSKARDANNIAGTRRLVDLLMIPQLDGRPNIHTTIKSQHEKGL
jgi:hypothetical protein